jgi:hypothetical protein
MKKIITILTVLLFALITSVNVYANDPPDPFSEPSTGDQPVGGGAPIGSGLFVLLGMAAVYGGRKIYKLKKEDLEE